MITLIETLQARLVRFDKHAERDAAVAMLLHDKNRAVPDIELPCIELSEVKCVCQQQSGYVGIQR